MSRKQDEAQADRDGEKFISKELQDKAEKAAGNPVTKVHWDTPNPDIEAQAWHDAWVQVELTRPGVDVANPLLCIWEMLSETDKNRYRKLANPEA